MLRTPILAALAALLPSSFALAQTPYLVKDIRTVSTNIQSSSPANVVEDAGSAPSSDPAGFIAARDQLFLIARGNSGVQRLWRSDATEAGTIELPPALYTSDPRQAAGSTLFVRQSSALLASDGTAAGTTTVKTFFNQGFGLGSSSSHYFVNGDGGFWVSDGTAAGTVPVQSQNGVLGTLAGLAELPGETYLLDSPSGGLWRASGAAATAKRIASYSGAQSLTSAAGWLWFTRSGTPSSLWRSDGTYERTISVAEFTAVSSPAAAIAGDAYFVAEDAVAGAELWRSDGTPGGTWRVADIHPGSSGSSPQQLTAIGDVLFFTADDGVHGVELWRSDGTVAGTTLVKDVAPGSGSSNPANLVAAEGVLWFLADDGAGVQLWRSDGTAAGTTMVGIPGATSANPANLTGIAGAILFSATEPLTGTELWAVAGAATRISIGDVRVVEGSSGATATVTVTRSGDVSGTSTVAYATRDGAATAGADYTETSGSLAFAAGETSKAIDVNVLSDDVAEGNEAFFVRLSLPVDAAISNDTAVVVIEDDDRRADLSIEILKPVNSSRSFRITNDGPSTATGVVLRITNNPGGTLVCDGCPIAVEPLAAGESRTLSYAPAFITMATDPDVLTSYTLTASISSETADPNPANNLDSRLLDVNGHLMLPPYLIATETKQGFYADGVWTFVQISSSDPLVTVSPTTFNSDPSPVNATFDLTAGSGIGWSVIAASTVPSARVNLPVIGIGGTARLATAVRRTNPACTYGSVLEIPVEIHGRRHDGVTPGGTVVLRDEAGNYLAEATLGANGTVSFMRSDLPVGAYTFKVQYLGDANFLGTRGTLTASVRPIPTTTTVALARTTCLIAEATITVTADGAFTPAGSVEVFANGTSVGIVPLVPSDEPAKARGFVRVQIGTYTPLEFRYRPTVDFLASVGYGSVYATNCSAFATSLYVLAPCRVIDTRHAAGPYGGPALGAGETRIVTLAGRCGIPATANAVSTNITVVSPIVNGFLRASPAAVLPVPNTTNVAFRTGKTRATMAVVTLNGETALEVHNGSSAPLHFIIDVFAYYD